MMQVASELMAGSAFRQLDQLKAKFQLPQDWNEFVEAFKAQYVAMDDENNARDELLVAMQYEQIDNYIIYFDVKFFLLPNRSKKNQFHIFI